MFLAERMSIIGLEGAKGQSIRCSVVKEEGHSGIAKTTVTIVEKDRARFFHSPGTDLQMPRSLTRKFYQTEARGSFYPAEPSEVGTWFSEQLGRIASGLRRRLGEVAQGGTSLLRNQRGPLAAQRNGVFFLGGASWRNTGEHTP
jgi:hypothetical protein